MKIFLEVSAFLMVVIASIVVIYTLIMGVDLTQGQMLIKFYPQYILVVGLLFWSFAIMNNLE